jgi:DNA polymerase phi
VKSNPTIGFTLILQLTGMHGSTQFDKLTRTKTIETILTNMTNDGIQSYIEYLLKQVNDEHDTKTYVAHPCLLLCFAPIPHRFYRSSPMRRP